MINTAQPLLQMKNISKRFPGVQALRNVSLEVTKGEIHALLGENGAGKSTLIKILSGIFQADSGEILFRGTPAHFNSPFDAWAAGISTIHQELMLIPQLTVAENIFLGKVPLNRIGLVDRQYMFDEAHRLLERLEIDANPLSQVADLPIALQQMVEIARALSFDAELIIMDEPTSALSQHEINVLFDRIDRLRAENRSVVFISHKLDEIFRLADRVTVLRDGENIGTDETKDLNSALLINRMVGRDLKSFFSKRSATIGLPVLEVKNLTIIGEFYDVSFSLHSGEILGIAGLVGAGRTDLALAIFGAEPVEQGHIFLDGQELKLKTPGDAIRARIGLVPENRKEQGLFLQMSVRENIVLPQTSRLMRAGMLNLKQEKAITSKYVEKLSIRTPSIEQTVVNLSGGNQQKVILARWLANEPRVLIVDEPTRGIDVGAKAEIHALLSELAAHGVGILLISSEMEEVLSMSDRILVMREGRIVAEFPSAEAKRELIAAHAIGAKIA